MIKKFTGPFLLVLILLLLFLFPFATSFVDKSSQVNIKNPPPSPWFLKDEKSKYALVYFGYVGCTTICIPSLNEIKELYKSLDKINLYIPFYFVNIDPKQDPELPQLFVESFDKRFNGIYLTRNQLEDLEKQYNLAINEGSIEISHSSNLFLFKQKDKKHLLNKIYITHPYDEEKLIETILN